VEDEKVAQLLLEKGANVDAHGGTSTIRPQIIKGKGRHKYHIEQGARLSIVGNQEH
jgi:hypothetical protein